MKRLIAACLLMVLLCGCAAGNGKPLQGTEPTQTGAGESGGFSGLGGTMPKMTFYTPNGESMTLSGLLEEKKLVVLNFWFADCIWCQREFPAMERSYHRYREDVEIIALNPVDSADAIRDFQQQYDLSFPMVSCPASWADEMGVRGYPTSIFIDREGVVCLIHSGAITDAETFDTLFEKFTADDYERTVYGSIAQALK